mmetsp:Transcript_94239/g.172727  ORF Transcript_94239/g.172727 Transcript_94239/m.172727 type:complete len:759 (-) Transcript_94239:66-2342(-)
MYKAVRECDMIIVTISTPVDEHLNPQFAGIERCVQDLRPFLHAGQTLLLRSTLFPGTSSRIKRILQDQDLNLGVSFCPERIAQGQALKELRELPQIISGSDACAVARAKQLFAPLGVDLIELELQEAEVAKLFLNSWRYVVFGTANQFYQIATLKGLDFHRIHKAITYKYSRAGGFPRPGFTAGPRLFKDTMQLAAYCRHTFSLGHAAMLVNETMPDTVLEQAKKELARRGRTINGMRCGILGMAFKPNTGDFRESLAFKLRRLLLWEGADLLCSDVYMHNEDFVDMNLLVAKCELIFIGCPHREYGELEFRKEHVVINCWGCTGEPKLSVCLAKDCYYLNDAKAKRVAIIGGAGHVGLPLSLVLAERGRHVVVVDTDAGKLESIKGCNFPFLETGGPELLRRCLAEFPERLLFSTDYAAVRGCELIIVTIGTPVDEHLNPQYSGIESCIKTLQPFLSNGQTLVLRSTLFPGTSSRVQRMLQAVGLEVGVSFCPERIAQGHALHELTQLPQIVSGTDAATLDRAKGLFAPLGVDLVELELQEAEVAKLFLNSWRYVVFGTANQFYQIATSKGLNFDRIHKAITHKYARAGGFPRPGFTAGPCLFKDTMQLAAYCRHTFSLGHAAMLVNETMPDTVLEQARKVLAQRGRSITGTACGILGMAFKPDNDDFRESLAFKLRRLLLWEGADLLCTDVYLHREGFVSVSELLARCDVIFIGCPHSDYRDIDFRTDQIVVDCWGAMSRPRLSISTMAERSNDGR